MKSQQTFEGLRHEFLEALRDLNKGKCVNLISDALRKDLLTIPELYEKILTPSLSNIASNEKEQEISIWEEHVQSGIVRTIVEICYPYLAINPSEDFSNRPVAIVFCLEEEYHELGARMSTDFLTLLGFNAIFIGANTPKEEAYDAIKRLKPILVSISITSFYHLSKVDDMIKTLHNFNTSEELNPFSIMVGGYAIEHSPNAKNTIHADYFAHSFEDLTKIKEAIL